MDLTPRDRARVTAGLARALPAWKDRADVAGAVGLSDVQLSGEGAQAWGALVDEAAARGRLPALVACAARLRPEDARLAVLARALAEGRKPPAGFSAAWAGLAVAFLAAMVVWTMWPGGHAPPSAPALEVEPIAEAEAVAVRDAPEVAPEVAPEAPVEPPPVPAEVAVPAAEPVVKPTASPPPAVPVAPTPAKVAPAAPGGCSGWAWMGATTSLKAGDTWRPEGGVHVRSDRPRLENGWRWQHTIVCTLGPGSEVLLAEDPVVVPGEATWVRVEGARSR